MDYAFGDNTPQYFSSFGANIPGGLQILKTLGEQLSFKVVSQDYVPSKGQNRTMLLPLANDAHE